MWLARAARRRGSLVRLAIKMEILGGVPRPVQLEAGGASLPHLQAAACTAPSCHTAVHVRLLSDSHVPATAGCESPRHGSSSDATANGSALSSSTCASNSGLLVPALPSSASGVSSGDAASGNSAGGGSVATCALLTARIGHATHAKRVLQLLRQAGQHCNSTHVGAAASRLAALHRQQPGAGNAQREAFSQLLRLAAEQRLELNSVAVGQLFRAAATLRYQPTSVQRAVWEELCASALAEAAPRNVANLLSAWSKLGFAVTRELAAAADAAVQRTAPTMNASELTTTLWAFATGGWQLSNRAVAALQQRLCAVLLEAEPSSVSLSLWALAKLGLPLETPFAAAADKAVQRTAAGMKPQEVCNTTLWAFATGAWQLSEAAAAVLLQRLWEVLPQADQQTVSNSLWAIAKLGLPLEGPLAMAADAAVQRTAAAMKPQEVSNTLWAHASGSWQLSEPAAAALLQRLEAVLPVSNGHDVSESLWALAKLGLPFDGQLAAAANAAMQRTAAALAPQGVANTLWAFATGAWQLSEAAAAVLLQRLLEVLPQADQQTVSNNLWALAKLGVPLDGPLAVAADAAVQPTAAAMKPQEVSNTLWAHASGGWQISSSAAAALLQRLEAVLPAAQPQDVANSLWGLATLIHLHGSQAAKPSPTLLSAVVAWADARWHQLPAMWVCDLCYNLARLGVQPDQAWIDAAVVRFLACIEAEDLQNARFANIIWACSKWQHSLVPEAMAALVVAAVDSVCVDWHGKGRRGGLRLVKSLAHQPGGFSVATSSPAAAAALQQRLLPLVCADIDAVVSLTPEGGELAYLADWAASCAAVGLRLPLAQLDAICSYAEQHEEQLDGGSRANLQRAFDAWSYQPGLALLVGRAATA